MRARTGIAAVAAVLSAAGVIGAATPAGAGTPRPPAAAASTRAGVEKWVPDTTTGQWTLAYTLSSGLKRGTPYPVHGYPAGVNSVTGLPWAPATDGLRNITGQVNRNGTVTIWGVTS